MPIFCIKSVKIYTGQKKFTRVYSWLSWQISGMLNISLYQLWSSFFKPKSQGAVRRGLWVAEGVGYSGKSTLHPEIVVIKGWWWYSLQVATSFSPLKNWLHSVQCYPTEEQDKGMFFSMHCWTVHDCTFDAATPGWLSSSLEGGAG